MLQEKAVIQAVCLRTQAVSIIARFRMGFGYVGKVRKFQPPKTNTFWSYVKKLQAPPAGIGLTILNSVMNDNKQ